MLFNSIEFLFWFLPLTLLAFHFAPQRFRVAVLCMSSLYFYSRTGMKPMYGLVVSIGWAWSLSFLFHRALSRTCLAAAVLFPLSILFFAKYSTFVLVDIPSSLGFDVSVKDIPAMLRIGFPAGISFYTFQLVSYNLDVYRKNTPAEKNPLLFATYIALFPQLIAGPILRYEQIRQQLIDLRGGKLAPNLFRGIKFLSIGLFVKTLGADMLATFCQPVVNAALSPKPSSLIHPLDGLFYLAGYSFRIYFDFWSYSVMAIGLAALFGLTLPKNFNEPYLSSNPQVFWRRWHLTLSYWLRDYVYIPLGGNRSYIRNILIVFIACGIWHGAGYGFIVWGGYHALLVIGYRFLRPWWDRFPAPLAIGLTFILVSLGWPLFDIGLGGYAALMDKLTLTAPMILSAQHFLFLLLVALGVFYGREDDWLYNEKPVRMLDAAPVQAALFFCALLFLHYGKTFIYFRF